MEIELYNHIEMYICSHNLVCHHAQTFIIHWVIYAMFSMLDILKQSPQIKLLFFRKSSEEIQHKYTRWRWVSGELAGVGKLELMRGLISDMGIYFQVYCPASCSAQRKYGYYNGFTGCAVQCECKR